MILVTAAEGKTGRAVIGALTRRGAPVRAFVHRQEQVPQMQPASYMQNILGVWEQIERQGIYATSYGLHAPMSLVDLEDVAEVAAMVLTEPGHRFAIYELSGPEALTAEKMTAVLTNALGRPVTAEALDVAQWEGRMKTAGLGEYSIAALAAMFRYYAQHGFVGNPNVLACLLRRPPTTFDQFVARVKERSA